MRNYCSFKNVFFCDKMLKNTKEENSMPGLHYCSECDYFNEGKCDAKHSDASAGKLACSEFSDKNKKD